MAQKPALALLFATLVIIMLGFGIVIPLMPFYVTHFNASGSALGLMMALYSLMQFLFAPLWGRVSDRVGRKPVLLLGIGGYGLAFALQGLAQDMVQFTLARTLAGVLSSATLPTALAYVADTTPAAQRSRGVGLLGAAMGLGMIFGPMLGGVLAHLDLPLPANLMALLQVMPDPTSGSRLNLSIPFFASACLALCAIPFVARLLPESLPLSRRVTAAGPTASRGAMLSEALRGPAGLLYVLAFVLAFALANFEAVLGLYGQQRFGMGPTDLGLLMGGLGILSVLQQGVLIGPLTRRWGETGVIRGVWSPAVWALSVWRLPRLGPGSSPARSCLAAATCCSSPASPRSLAGALAPDRVRSWG